MNHLCLQILQKTVSNNKYIYSSILSRHVHTSSSGWRFEPGELILAVGHISDRRMTNIH